MTPEDVVAIAVELALTDEQRGLVERLADAVVERQRRESMGLLEQLAESLSVKVRWASK